MALSELAIDSEMVGTEGDAAPIGGDEGKGKACCWEAAAASNADVADCSVPLDLGEVEKN